MIWWVLGAFVLGFGAGWLGRLIYEIAWIFKNWDGP